MANVTFDNLITQQYLHDVAHDIPGVGTVTMRQLSAVQVGEIMALADDLEGDDLETFISRKALSFVKGSEPSDDEVNAFRKNQSAKTISLIYTKGLQSAPPAMDFEAAEKN